MQRSVLKRFAPVVAAAFASAILSLGCTEENPVDPGTGNGVDVPTAGKSVETLIKDGTASLEDGKFDEALAYYEAAYQKDNNDPNAIAYSVLAKVAGISVDQKVVNLLKNRVGFTNYPNKLNALLNSDWLTNYTERERLYEIRDEASGKWASWYDEWDIDYYGLDQVGYYYSDWVDGDFNYVLVSTERAYGEEWDNFLPGLATPEWIKGGPNSLYNQSLVDGAPGMETYALLLLANLLDKNTAGLNGLLDDLIDAVFGSGFDEICARVDKLKGKGPIKLDGAFLDELDYEDMIDEFDGIGWAEVNVVISFMTGIKASLQYIASYDWNTNLNFLKYAWDTEENFYNKVKGVSASDLPFGNNFLKARPGKMAAAKTSFKKAVEGLKASYEAIQNDGKYPQVVKDAYPTLKAGADQLIAAIDGGVFYILDSDPTTSSWPTSGNGIDMGKVFTEGYFSLDKLFETDGGKPVFYVIGEEEEVCEYDEDWDYEYCWYEDRAPERLTPANYRELLENSYAVALMLKTSHVASIVVGPDAPSDLDNVPFSVLPPKYGQLLFEKFYGLDYTPPVAKARVKTVAHAGK